MLSIGTDRIGVRYHGIAHTHVDALAHVNESGTFYNGYTPDADARSKDPGCAADAKVVDRPVSTRPLFRG